MIGTGAAVITLAVPKDVLKLPETGSPLFEMVIPHRSFYPDRSYLQRFSIIEHVRGHRDFSEELWKQMKADKMAVAQSQYEWSRLEQSNLFIEETLVRRIEWQPASLITSTDRVLSGLVRVLTTNHFEKLVDRFRNRQLKSEDEALQLIDSMAGSVETPCDYALGSSRVESYIVVEAPETKVQ